LGTGPIDVSVSVAQSNRSPWPSSITSFVVSCLFSSSPLFPSLSVLSSFSPLSRLVISCGSTVAAMATVVVSVVAVVLESVVVVVGAAVLAGAGSEVVVAALAGVGMVAVVVS